MTNKMIISTRVLKTALTTMALTAMMASGSVMAGSLKSGTTLQPGHGMSFVVGNKRATTYFHPSSGACEVTVMVSEASPMIEVANYVPASRLRMKLTPGNATKIDSFEGKSISVVCNEDAKTMTIMN
jgi:hypothetical protein